MLTKPLLMMKKALIIFVRKPELGKVKTRIAATLGNERALAIYQLLLQHTKDITEGIHADLFVYYANEIDYTDLWNTPFKRKKQTGDDLGAKMKNAFEELFAEGYGKVLIIGSDCFELTRDLIENAFESLDRGEIVIGPAKDGGYYLLGMKKLYTSFFGNKEWSTESIYQQTLNDIINEELSYISLPMLIDVDTAEDIPVPFL